MKRVLVCSGLVMAWLVGMVAAAETPPAENQLREDHLPTPFSAEQIRGASPEGYTTRHLIETSGRPPVQSVNAFHGGDETMARFRYYTATAEGELMGEVQTGEAPWAELQAHASFPTERTTVETAAVEVAAGAFDCWRYTVRGAVPVEGGEPRTVVSQFWFAKELPGPPVKMVQTIDGEVAMTMELLSAKVE